MKEIAILFALLLFSVSGICSSSGKTENAPTPSTESSSIESNFMELGIVDTLFICTNTSPFQPIESIETPLNLIGSWVYFDNAENFLGLYIDADFTFDPSNYDGAGSDFEEGFLIYFSFDIINSFFRQDTLFLRNGNNEETIAAAICSSSPPVDLISFFDFSPSPGGLWVDQFGIILASSFIVPANYPIGSELQFTYVSLNQGCQSNLILNLTVTEDLEAPELNCGGDLQVGVDGSFCGAIVNYPIPSATDACSSVELSLIEGLPSGEIFPLGETLVSYQAIDLAGNLSTCSFTIEVIDDLVPSISCSNISQILLESESFVLEPSDVGMASDECGILTESISQTTFTLVDEGVNVVTYTAIDESGNLSTCNFEVEILPCLADGGVLSTNSLTDFCVGDLTNNVVELNVEGAVGTTTAFGLLDAETLQIVDVSGANGFGMSNRPPGEYLAVHFATTDPNFLPSANISDLEGCFGLSNFIEISVSLNTAGTITANQDPQICIDDGPATFNVTGAVGDNLKWAVYNSNFSERLAVSNTGAFDFSELGQGVYKVVHTAYANGVPVSQVSPSNPFPECFDASNILNVIAVECPQTSVWSQPNPANDISTVSFMVPDEGMVQLELFDNTGRAVRQVYHGNASAELDYRFDVMLDGLPNGMYIYRLTTSEGITVNKIFKGN
ncbi:MAG: HYR domain-containing protein [Bacteroidota bacterium]